MRWLRWILGVLVVGCVVSFVVDAIVFNLRGSPSSTIRVSHFLSAPLKNNKQELDYLGSEDESCSMSLFPQAGKAPCWYLRRHTNQIKTI